jgi:[ribosomal protein S18]-alanine N-acetyltransferase
VLSRVAVEIALPQDAEAIAAMSRDLIEYGLRWGWQQDRVLRSIAAPDTNVAVVRDGSVLAGFGIMEYEDEDAHLVLFAVSKAHQRRGMGTELLVWLEESARVAGAERVRVEARRENVAARCFYNHNGYHEQVIRRRMYSNAVDGVRLEKWLRHRAPRNDA